jgi:hypothetical protein
MRERLQDNVRLNHCEF